MFIFAEIYFEMVALKKIVLSVVLLIILAVNSIAFQIPQSTSIYLNPTDVPDPVSTSTIEKPETACYMAIENHIPTQNISEVHRLFSGIELLNRILPSNLNFRKRLKRISSENFVSAIPIFIRGHALRH